MRLSRAIDAYLSYKNTHSKQNTVKTYSLQLGLFLKFAGDLEFKDLTIGEVTAYQESLRNKYSLATVAFGMIIIKGFIYYFYRQQLAPFDPILIRVPRFVPNSHESVTYDEFLALERVYDDHEYSDCQRKLIIRILYETGVRVSELCDIQLCDIDAQHPYAVIETRKSYDKRYIQWSEETHQILIKFLGVRICTSGKYLFQTSRGKMTPRTCQRIIKEACRKAGISKCLSPHSFRHGKAHRMAELGADLIKIKTVMGHANPNSSFKYLNFSKHEIGRMAQEFL